MSFLSLRWNPNLPTAEWLREPLPYSRCGGTGSPGSLLYEFALAHCSITPPHRPISAGVSIGGNAPFQNRLED